MPEGPECRKIAESLAKFASGKTLISVEILSGRYTKKLPTGFEYFKESFPVPVVGVGVHGKFIYWILKKDFSIWNTLGMSGSWSSEEEKHSRVKFNFLDGSRVYFNDQRNFGTLKFVGGKQPLIEKLTSLGPDMLAKDVSDDLFIERVRKKNSHNICKVLMDQAIVCGVGNYIKADSLWLAKISPHRSVEEITNEELKILNSSIKKIIRESYNSGGATIRTYKNFDGDSGQYASRFLVYNRKVDPEGNEIIKEPTPDGRQTHWVPKIQR
jgi:formamidopyrimidine-DNA glycosylase